MITKKEQEQLSEIQSEIQAEIEFLEGLFNEINEINEITDNSKAFNKNNISEYLQNFLTAKDNKFMAFTKELAQLSKEYGVAIKSTGGVIIGEIKEIEYSDDETSGDLYPRVIEWAE